MAGMIFNKEPFFKGSDNYDQLEQITRVLGTEELYQYINKYNIKLEAALERILGDHKSVKLASFVNEQNKHLATPDALDILSKMMQYDHVSSNRLRISDLPPWSAWSTNTSTRSEKRLFLSDPELYLSILLSIFNIISYNQQQITQFKRLVIPGVVILPCPEFAIS